MSTTPDPDDRHDSQHEIRGLDGEPLEITDEKLHELIDAMNEATASLEFESGMAPEEIDTEDFVVAKTIMGGPGLLESAGGTQKKCIIINVDFFCHHCEEQHDMSIAIPNEDSVAGFFRDMAKLADRQLGQ